MDRNDAEYVPKCTIIQFGIGWAWELLEIGSPIWAAFAKAHGFEYRCEREKAMPKEDRSPHWSKIFLINEWLRDSERGDFLIWADADTIPVRLDVDPRTALGPDFDLTMCKTIFSNWNTGMMFIRSSKITSQFYDSVWCMGPVPRWGTRWNDEARVNNDLPYWQRKGLRVQVLDPIWNDFDRIPVRAQNPVVKAWHGTPKDTVLRRMKEEAAKIKWLS